ncbi:S-layer homology domain-containing protein [Paenibacillus aestuarii]|uniref:S-layer homology domain-containing protein n=1 Tax=Paenibacillus aestuarii TaxID=516965 RepID=A0ABW0K1Q1_9BACL|nr:S-layer homology domain-containing protein [Paenibacillus aestuarii]
MQKNLMKKVVATSLALTMVMGGASAAFAHDKDDREDNQRHESHGKGGNNFNFNGNTNVTINFNFNDMNGASWALRYIASLSSKRVFEGYEDGSFKPNNSVSRIEAITAAVRLMGLRDKAESAAEMQTKLNFRDADQVPSWAVGYVAVALENDLFSEKDDAVKPDQPADRLWATTLLIKALKLDTEAKTKMNSTLTFIDANKIPAGSVGYVEEAIEKKLVDGFEDNTFRPYQNVTRAQLAALLDRTNSQLPDQDPNNFTGTVNALVTNNTLSLTTAGTTTSYTLHPDVFVLRNGVKVNATDLQVGDEVKVHTFNNTVVYVEVTNLASQTNSNVTSGTIISAVNNNVLYFNGAAYPYTLSPTVVIYRNGSSVPASALQVGDVVNITTSGNQITLIQVTTLAQQSNVTSGTITSTVYNNVLNLNNAGTVTPYTLSPSVVVTRSGATVAASALQVGDVANITVSGNQVTSIQVTTLAQANQGFDVYGTFNSTTPDAQGRIAQISINGANGITLYNVSPTVIISGDRTQLVQNHLVELKGYSGVVTSIEVK